MSTNIQLGNIYKDCGKPGSPTPTGVTVKQNQSLTQCYNMISPISQSGQGVVAQRANNGNLSGEPLYGGSPTLQNISLLAISRSATVAGSDRPFLAWKYVPTGYAANNGIEGTQPFDCIDHLVQGTNWYGVRQITHGVSQNELSPDSASMGIAFQNSGSVLDNTGDFAGTMNFAGNQSDYIMTDSTDENGKSILVNTAFRMPETTTSGETATHCFWIKYGESYVETETAIYCTNGNSNFPTNKAFVNAGFVFWLDTEGYANVQRFDGTNGTSTCFNMQSPQPGATNRWNFFAFQVSNNSNTISTSTNYAWIYAFIGRGFQLQQGGTSTGGSGKPRTGMVTYAESGKLIYNPQFSSGWLANNQSMNGIQLGHHYIFTNNSSDGGEPPVFANFANMVGTLNSGSQYF